jgi:hypothetical protein
MIKRLLLYYLVGYLLIGDKVHLDTASDSISYLAMISLYQLCSNWVARCIVKCTLSPIQPEEKCTKCAAADADELYD